MQTIPSRRAGGRKQVDHLHSLKQSQAELTTDTDEWSLSPFTSIIWFVSRSKSGSSTVEVLQSVVNEHGILQRETAVNSLHALLESLSPSMDLWKPKQHVFEFLDNCILRFIKKPLKYFGDTEDLVAHFSSEGPVSNLILVLVEQWPFFTKDRGNVEIGHLATWISRYLKLAVMAGENCRAIQTLRSQMRSSPSCEEVRSMLEIAFRDEEVGQASASQLTSETEPARQEDHRSATDKPRDIMEQKSFFLDRKLKPEAESGEYPSLITWRKKDMEDVVEDFDVGNLLLYLSCGHSEIRQQAIAQLRNLMARLKVSFSSIMKKQ